MKNLIQSLILTSLVFTLSIQGNTITLTSHLLKTIDGSLINADTIEIIRRFQRKLIEILFKELDTIANLTPTGKKATIASLTADEAMLHKELAQCASDTEQHAAILNSLHKLNPIITQVKIDFIKLGNEFRAIAQGAKPIIAQLITESCTKRGRPNSLLVLWANTKETDEDQLFNTHVNSLQEYQDFSMDLYHYLNDLIHSCPKAKILFEDRVKKWTKIRELVSQVVPPRMPALEHAFTTYIKTHHLDHLKLSDITIKQMQALLTTFKQQA